MNSRVFDELGQKEKKTGEVRYATKKWGDPLQRPHRTGEWAFSSKQINCTCQASL